MPKQTLHIATRQSKLALWQANFIKQSLEKKHPELEVKLLGITTSGDQNQQDSLSKIGGKGLFVKELENALLDKSADIAVHSMKDVPKDLPDGLCIPVIAEREDPRDVFVSNIANNLSELSSDSVIGTSSLRRSCQLHALRPDIKSQALRGNVDTRLKRLDEGNFSAIILAAAGLIRLGLQEKIQEYLNPDIFIPAVGQGALGIECRIEDEKTRELIQFLNHPDTASCVHAERAMNNVLNGSCQVPIAGFATLTESKIILRGMVGRPDGSLVLNAQGESDRKNAEELGKQLAEELLSQGANEILREFRE
jgi:hydroxymethylbilane synthase